MEKPEKRPKVPPMAEIWGCQKISFKKLSLTEIFRADSDHVHWRRCRRESDQGRLWLPEEVDVTESPQVPVVEKNHDNSRPQTLWCNSL